MSYGGVPGRVGDALEPYDDSRSGTARETRDGPGPGHGRPGRAAGRGSDGGQVPELVGRQLELDGGQEVGELREVARARDRRGDRRLRP